ncbi:DNA-directed RNA polymerase subunit alpha [Candidatus Saccharibacteria bacterium]|nr:DNA-directed RNA polymerase subunit alpha [Candidatus Saccharibacteria bacterium]MCL1962660.1 DNA-directed RNA polymerase subunit alpha [Candidatus Saccharibacteria bacterium]
MSKTILNPTISDIEIGDNNSATITVKPIASGYGQTLGNSLRRVLLSSIEGSAITAFRIDGVGHEFMAITGVKEDVVEIMLNIKAISLKCFSDKPVEVSLVKKGGVVTAGDIKATADIEIVNPDQLIATIDDPGVELKIDFVIENGRGYQSIEESSARRVHSDMIALDAVFSPVRRVRYSVEKTRVGDNVDLDQLVMIIDTDGSITPVDALEQAAAILVEQYSALAGNALAKIEKTAAPKSEEDNDLLSLPIEELNMSARTTNALIGNEIKTVGELVNLSDEELSNLKGFGAKAQEEVKERVAELEF